MPGVHKVELVGQEVVADYLGVTTSAISNWFARAELAPEGSHLKNLPVPTLIEFKPGKKPQKAWRRAQLPVWGKWHARHLADEGRYIPQRNRKAG